MLPTWHSAHPVWTAKDSTPAPYHKLVESGGGWSDCQHWGGLASSILSSSKNNITVGLQKLITMTYFPIAHHKVEVPLYNTPPPPPPPLQFSQPSVMLQLADRHANILIPPTPLSQPYTFICIWPPSDTYQTDWRWQSSRKYLIHSCQTSNKIYTRTQSRHRPACTLPSPPVHCGWGPPHSECHAAGPQIPSRPPSASKTHTKYIIILHCILRTYRGLRTRMVYLEILTFSLFCMKMFSRVCTLMWWR